VRLLLLFQRPFTRNVKRALPIVYIFPGDIVPIEVFILFRCSRSNLPLTVVACMMSIWFVGTSSFLP
jgi:hypothetical protein